MSEPYDPRLVLIQWLVSRTERNHLSWTIEHDDLTALVALPPLVHVRFAGCTQATGQHERWNSFSMRNQDREILQVDSNHSTSDNQAVFDAANALFAAALKSRAPTVTA